MDWFAVASLGAYPTPTPSASARAAYAASYGLLDTLYAAAATATKRSSWLLYWFTKVFR